MIWNVDVDVDVDAVRVVEGMMTCMGFVEILEG
jgi:hypothetical protein